MAGPSVAVASQALGDRDWQDIQRADLLEQSVELERVLTERGFSTVGATSLYTLAMHAHAQAIWQHLARRQILVRRFDEQPTWLRFGLPGEAANVERLSAALSEFASA